MSYSSKSSRASGKASAASAQSPEVSLVAMSETFGCLVILTSSIGHMGNHGVIC